MKGSMKGISPVVASVILIAVSISVGVLVSTWITHLVEEQTGGARLCAINTLYNVESAKFNISADNNLWLKITNEGEYELYGFGVVIDNGTMIIIMNSTDNRTDQGNMSSSNKLKRKESLYLIVNLTNTTEEGVDYQGFGLSLTTSSSTDIVVTNEACTAISSEAITSVSTS